MNTHLELFAKKLSENTQTSILTEFEDFEYMLSFGYFWEKENTLSYYQTHSHSARILHPLFLEENSQSDVCSIRYEVGTELGVAWLLAYALCNALRKSDTKSIKPDSLALSFFALLDEVDIGFLASESNLSEEELLGIGEWFINNQKQGYRFAYTLGYELSNHHQSAEILKILSALAHIFCLYAVQFAFIMPQLAHPIIPNQHTPLNSQSLPSLCDELPESNGNFIYLRESKNIDSSHLLSLEAPTLFAPSLNLQDSQIITLCFEDQELKACYKLCPNLKGTIALLYLPKSHTLGYPYKKVEVRV